MRYFELIAILAVFVSLANFATCENRKELLILFITASVTVAAGEIINLINSTTIYNENFSMIPKTALPIFIIPLGAVISVWTFQISRWMEKRFSSRKFAILAFFAISAVFPFFSEFVGIKLNIWKWNIPFQFSFFFLAGIWKFYFIFIFLPTLIFLFLSRKNSQPTT